MDRGGAGKDIKRYGRKACVLRVGGNPSLCVSPGPRARALCSKHESRERRLDVRLVAASDHDPPIFRRDGRSVLVGWFADLERNIEPGAAGGMGSEAEYVEHAEIAGGKLCEADRVLQSQSLVAREPQVSRPFPPLRRRKAIEHDEAGPRIARVELVEQVQPELELLRRDGTVLALAQSDRNDDTAGQRHLQEIVDIFTAKRKQLDAAAATVQLDLARRVARQVREVAHTCGCAPAEQLAFRR